MLKLPIQFGQCLHICAACVLGRMDILYFNFQRATFEFLHQDDLVLCCTTNVSILANSKGEFEAFAIKFFLSIFCSGYTERISELHCIKPVDGGLHRVQLLQQRQACRRELCASRSGQDQRRYRDCWKTHHGGNICSPFCQAGPSGSSSAGPTLF